MKHHCPLNVIFSTIRRQYKLSFILFILSMYFWTIKQIEKNKNKNQTSNRIQKVTSAKVISVAVSTRIDDLLSLESSINRDYLPFTFIIEFYTVNYVIKLQTSFVIEWKEKCICFYETSKDFANGLMIHLTSARDEKTHYEYVNFLETRIQGLFIFSSQ